MRLFIRSFIFSIGHTFLLLFALSCVRSFVRFFIHSFRSFTCSFTNSLTPSYIRSFIHSLSPSFVLSFIRSVGQSDSRRGADGHPRRQASPAAQLFSANEGRTQSSRHSMAPHGNNASYTQLHWLQRRLIRPMHLCRCGCGFTFRSRLISEMGISGQRDAHSSGQRW